MSAALPGHARSAPEACSVLADLAEAPASGTAAVAAFWVALEQPGPWGRQAATQSHLPADLGAALERACAARGGRLILIRRPVAHPDVHRGGRRCYVAWSGPGAFLRSTVLPSAEDLLGLDLDALAAGREGPATASLPGLAPTRPVLLVCTNGRRDVCCAVRGRPVAAAEHAAYPGRVWECSHTGGHRYAPTGLLLPWGRTLARLDEPAARGLLDAAGGRRLPVALLGARHDRGWSALAPAAQAAESAVRAQLAETDLDALTAQTECGGSDAREDAGESATVTVRHRDGRAWQVEVERHLGDRRPESCGKEPVPSGTWSARVTSPR